VIRVGAPIWLGLRFEMLPLEAIADGDGKPLAIAAQQRIHLSNVESLEPGMTVATANALVPGLVIANRRLDLEQQALAGLARWAYRITPAVTIAEDNSLLLEIGSCRRLYGNLPRLLAGIGTALAGRGHRVALGLAHTPKAAWLLAQVNAQPALRDALHIDAAALERQLAAIPVAALPIDSKIRIRLQHMGIETLGHLLEFDPALLGKRFGAECIRYLQQLTGHLPDPQVALELAPQFDQSLAFLDGIANRQTLLFPMKRLLQSFSDYLVARQLYCRALQWRFSDAHRMCGAMDIELSRPHHRWQPLLDLSQLQLEQVELPELVFSVALHADQFLPAGAASFQLFEEDCANEEGHALLDRLASRLGAAALQRIGTVDTLWPEAASACMAWSELPRQSLEPCGERPTFLLPTPQRLRERDGALAWRAPLEILRGPERLESPPERGEVKRRDYYIARERTGRLCWIFRDLETGGWFAHGLFA
jgi:protein ImuB